MHKKDKKIQLLPEETYDWKTKIVKKQTKVKKWNVFRDSTPALAMEKGGRSSGASESGEQNINKDWISIAAISDFDGFISDGKQ